MYAAKADIGRLNEQSIMNELTNSELQYLDGDTKGISIHTMNRSVHATSP